MREKGKIKMLKSFRRGEMKERVEYRKIFYYDRDGGFSFPCDKSGNLLKMSDCARKNYENAMAHPEQFETFNKLDKTTFRYRENNVGVCECGEIIYEGDFCYMLDGNCYCEDCINNARGIL